MQTSTSRRALLKAAPIAAAGIAIPAFGASPSADRRAWEAAMATYAAAKRTSDDYDAVHFSPAYDRETAFEKAHGIEWGKPGALERRKALQAQTNYQVPDAMNDEQEHLVECMCDAEHAVLQTPAPDLSALRWKLERVIDADPAKGQGTSPWSPEYVAQTIADIARLLPEVR